jgi:hypothetical protein
MLLSFATSAAEPAAGHASPVHASPEQEIVAAEDIFSQLMIGEPVRYDNVTVAGSLDLAELQGPLPQPVKITNSIFTGPVSFAGASFDQPLDLQGSLFQDNANFAGCRFLGGARLAGAAFQGQADLRNAYFGGQASFFSAQFAEDASFGNSQFAGDAVFLNSSFARDVDFDFAQFQRLASFADASFVNVSFLETQFGGHTTFLDARFQGNAAFAATRFLGSVVFRGASFSSGSTFGLSSFGGLADFTNVYFNSTAYFGGVRFTDLAYFINARFDRDLNMEDSRLYNLRLDNVSFMGGSRINLNNSDFTKLEVRWGMLKDRLVYNGAAYLALVKNYKSLEWFDDSDDCYYQYRRIGQDQAPWGWGKISDLISWLSCGYGVRVSYTSFWCLFTILFFGVVFWAGKGMNKFEIVGMELPGDTSLKPTSRVSFTDALYFSIAMFTTSQAPVNTYPVGVYRHLAMAEGILGWFFLGLFVVVLSGVLIR